LGVTALLLLVVIAVSGCRRVGEDRSSLDLEQALHGHWSCTSQISLSPDAEDWDVVGRPEQPIIEIDRFVDVRSVDKTWVEQSGDLRWRTVSQTPETGEIVVTTWSPANPKATRRRVMRFDRERKAYLELLPSKGPERTVQRWTYINGQGSP
jgi:hypothetical protein